MGMAKGSFDGFPRAWNRPKKLLLNNFFNALAK